METRVPADQGSSGAYPGPRMEPALERRLSNLESRLDDLDAAIHDSVPPAWRQALETACRNAVAEELRAVSDDMRRAVSELGRLLLRDLDRLTKVLADHRDTIVDRLLAAAEDIPESSAAPPAAGEPPPSPPPDPDVLGGEAGRWRVLPGRRRGRAQRRAGRGGAADG